MIRPLLLLLLVQYFVGAAITTTLSSHFSEILKFKCDALPFRTVYIESNCYIVVDTDGSDISSKCSTVLPGAQFAEDAPEAVWRVLLVEKHLFMLDGDTTGKKKAMCVYESQFPPSTSLPTSIAGTTIRREEQKLTAQMRLPFRLPFTKGLEVGQTIIIKGTYLADEFPNFTINLQSGTGTTQQSLSEKGVMPFHISAEFQHDRVKFLTLTRSGEWPGDIQKNPLKKGVPFDIRIRILESSFQVFLDQKELFIHKARLSYTLIKNLYVYGGGHLSYVQLGEAYDPVPYSTTMMQTSVANVTRTEPKEDRKELPYALPLTEKLEPGRMIVIKGAVTPPEPKKQSHFTINLQSGSLNMSESEKHGVNVPFHISFRIWAGHVCFNTMTKGNWHVSGKEEHKTNPLKTGDQVDIRIRILQYGYQVLLNGREFYVYKSRISMSHIDHLFVYGNGYLTQAYLEEKYYPIPLDSSFATGFPMCYKQSCSTQREWYTTRVLEADCKTVLISGVAFVQKQGFSINLISKSGNIALKFNPRLDKKNVALNSLKDKKWLVEETVNKLPFKKNVQFEVAITNEANGFQIFVNGEHFVTYVHRVCPFDINVVEIQYVFDLNVQVK